MLKTLLLVLLVSALPVAVRAQLAYTNTGAEIIITGYSGPDGVVIPSQIAGLPVTTIGYGAFQNHAITSVTMPTNVVDIESQAFDASALASVTIPVSVTNIGSEAFDECNHLTNITVAAANPAFSSTNGVLFDKLKTLLIQFPIGNTGGYAIPGGVTNIGDYSFNGCVLDSVTIPASIVRIGNSAFRLTTMTNLTIPNGVVIIGSGAFGFSYMDSVAIPDSVATIGSGAFFGGRLTSVSLGSGVTNLDIEAFDGNFHLTNITVNASNTAFSSTNGVLFNKPMTMLVQFPTGVRGSYTIPNGVTNIGDYSLNECQLESVTIPASLTGIGTSAFFVCQNMTNFTVTAGNTVFASTNGVLFDKTLTTLIEYPLARTDGAYVVPNTVITIGNNAFNECVTLTNVTIPVSVTNIGSAAFYFDVGLTTVTIPGSVTVMGFNAFAYCTNLTSAYFLGNAPPDDHTAFVNSPAIVYYHLGTAGWGATFGSVPAVLLTPHLSIILSGTTNVILTWPTNVPGFTLQFTTNLAAPATWKTNSPLPVVRNGLNTVTNAISGGQKLYRLD